LAVVTGTNPPAVALAGGSEPVAVGTPRGPVEVFDAGTHVVVGRHGSEVSVPAHLVDHERNLRALVALGCDRVLAVASTGSLRRDLPTGSVIAPDDLFGPWVNPTIFDDQRGHSVPGFDPVWRAEVVGAWRDRAATPIHDGGVYVQTGGPRFETPAEIRFFATVGDVIGMTVFAECLIARELGLSYAAVCVVDNLANGLGDRPLTVEEFRAGVEHNRDRMVRDLSRVIPALSPGSTRGGVPWA
jgi:5'-methylthioadenosine phosphorylase